LPNKFTGRTVFLSEKRIIVIAAWIKGDIGLVIRPDMLTPSGAIMKFTVLELRISSAVVLADSGKHFPQKRCKEN
jgi:hypothetical protein